MTYAIETHQLTKRFKDFTAVHSISFKVKKGSVFGLLGPNGAGKSTTIKMLCTLLKPTAGSCSICGFDSTIQGDEVRKRIGIIFQDPSLDDRLTARENLELHCLFYKVPKKERKQRIQEALQLVELEELQDKPIRTFSGGMKRRLEIARGLLHEPEVLFLDEPTIGLDPQTRKRIWEYLYDLQKRRGLTILMTTHYMEEAEFCDQIVIIDQGRIIAEGTPAQLKERVAPSMLYVESTSPDLVSRVEAWEYTMEMSGRGWKIETKEGEGERLVARLIQDGVSLQKIEFLSPTLDDVFLHLTGKTIRDEGASSTEQMRASRQRRGGR